MAYFMIYTRDDGEWSPQFGDSDRECVEQERIDTYLGQRRMRYEGDGKYLAADIRIVSFKRNPTQPQVTAKTLELNQ